MRVKGSHRLGNRRQIKKNKASQVRMFVFNVFIAQNALPRSQRVAGVSILIPMRMNN